MTSSGPARLLNLGRRALVVSVVLAVCIGAARAAASAPGGAGEPQSRRALILQSYHLGDLFADNTRRGLAASFAQSGLKIDVFVEHLDANRVRPAGPYLAQFAELLRLKYASIRFSVIVACDNDAMDFLRARRDALFPGVPIVFTGINHYNPAMLDGRTDITGIAGDRDTLAALMGILRVRPDVRHIVVITDNTTTGQAERADLETVAPRMPTGIGLRVLSLGDLTLEELGDRVAALPDDHAILFTHGSVDRQGRAYAPQETTPYLSRRAAVPIFVVNDARVGLGALGGLVASGQAAGLAAGNMAVAIIKGTDIRQIPVLPRTPTRYVFDYAVMRRFGMSASDVPDGSIFLNRPPSILDQYRSEVAAAAITFLMVVAFAVVLALEVVRRRRVEASLRKSQTTLTGILNSAPQGIFWKDRQGVYLGCNDVFARAVGLADSSLVVGKTDFELCWSRGEAEAYRADDAEVVSGNRPKRGIVEPLRQADGDVRWIDTTKIPLVDELGRTYGVLGVYTDITDRKRAEEERARLLDQLQQAAKMEAVGRLAGGVAHDFNNLLTTISGNVELAREDLHAPDVLDRHLGEIQTAAASAASLTRQLLAFSRKQMIEPKVVNLNELIGHLQKMLARLIGEDITLQTVLAPDLGYVRVDPVQFEQALINLAANARDAMPDGGTLAIETANVQLDEHYCASHAQVSPGPFVVVAVTDTGSGMTADVKSHLFEPFFTTKPKERGTGLGLATTFGSISQMGGNIEVYSEIGLGTTFKIYVPQVDPPPAAPAPSRSIGRVVGGRETVLLVEDEPSVREMTVRMLERLGYTVLSAPSGAAALKLVDDNRDPIDLLLTDVVMPGMNGRDLAERLVAIYPRLKVLFASGYTENVIVHHGLVDEHVNFIAKPYSKQALASKLRQVLG